ncbi:1-deoxy-D-xylulose-5-phosphate synthase [Sediminicola luteus]|uniref:1-deoxy-D-xylulose-5-phosphate synthase n=1 Tax=Sediminicola luteus TaxID=319238 RepID=A0A2A4GCH2_9FLAO|nr:1-deoxy-D-xylulose-5-phosphate synthase [Sediminicola luteus]PCE66307.1 1-deoxy-D-xylulose-5-phosphate synthase [Sediminicola luteus]
MPLLDHIQFPADLRKLDLAELPQLAQELRRFIIDVVATKEGHLGASLGVVELTIALHYTFNTPEDLLIWDVGHQAYGHKILTGRKAQFHTNRQFEGLSGFPKRSESPYDVFGTGHSSTSISALMGMALAAKISGKTDRKHIAVIGDASIASGMAFEGLNHAGDTDVDMLVVLNDNAIGIDPSVGALKHYLTQVKQGNPSQDNIFEALNFTYSGPIDGHDLPALIAEMERLKKVPGPKFLHVVTTKGKGLQQAEENQVTYHAPGKFDRETGELLPKNTADLPPKFQDVFGHAIVELAQRNPKIVGITPAMPTGSSLKYMMAALPERAFDVGIAEQHAVTMAAGIAAEGLVPFCNIYSTFLQRAYDQVIHDVALQKLPVVFCLDRAGIVGKDGPTHHGAFDLAYLRCVPNLIVCAPKDGPELRNLLYTAQLGLDRPMAIRYPRGRDLARHGDTPFSEINIGKGETIQKGTEIAVLSIGPIGAKLYEQQTHLEQPQKVGHYNMRFVKPLDTQLLHRIFTQYREVVTVEDGCLAGGFGSAVLEWAQEQGYALPIKRFGIPDRFVTHGPTATLNETLGLDTKTIITYINQKTRPPL